MQSRPTRRSRWRSATAISDRLPLWVLILGPVVWPLHVLTTAISIPVRAASDGLVIDVHLGIQVSMVIAGCAMTAMAIHALVNCRRQKAQTHLPTLQQPPSRRDGRLLLCVTGLTER